MAENVIPLDETKLPKVDTFNQWLEAQKIPVVRGFFVEDLNKIELAPWDLYGGLASFVILDGTGGVNDGYVCEIAPGQKLKPQKHLYEEMIYITKGVGATSVWQKNGKKHTFEWGPGSLFAMPLNAAYQHFNASGSEPARYFAVTNSCFMMNLFHNLDFIFDNEFACQRQAALALHQSRFDGEDLPADFRPCEAGGQANLVLLFGEEIPVFQDTEVVVDVCRRDFDAEILSVGDNLARHFPADVGDLAVQVAHAGFMRVVPDDVRDGFVREFHVVFRQARRFELPGDQETLRDLVLFLFRVAGQAEDLHAVLQGLRNRVQHVGCADEHHFRQIVFDVEIVIRGCQEIVSSLAG